MRIYARVLYVLGCIHFAVCLLMTVCGYINYDLIYGGALLNTIGSVMIYFCLWGMVALYAIFKIYTRRTASSSFSLPRWAKIVYAMILLNVFYICFFMEKPDVEGGTYLTGVNLLWFLAISLVANFLIIFDTREFLRAGRNNT